MANFNNIKNEIDQNVNTNGQQAITGAILNETLKDMLDEVNDKKQDTLVAGQNITISGNVISATGGSGQAYSAGDGINIDSNNVISVDASDLAGSGLEVDEFGALKTDPSVVQAKLTAGSNISISGNTISATDTNTTYSAGSGLNLTGTTFSADTSVLQEKLVSGQNLKTINGNSLLGSGDIQISGGTTYSQGHGIDIDSQDQINVNYGAGLTLDGNDALTVDTTTIQPKLTAGSGISISAQNVISATGGGGGGTTYGDGDAISIDSNDNINVLYGFGLQLDGNGNLEVNTSDLNSGLAYLPLGGGVLQDGMGDTQLKVMDADYEDYVRILAPDTAGEQPHIEIFENGSGDTKFFYDHIERGSQVSIDLPSSSGTLALTSDIPTVPTASSLAGNGLQDDGNGALEIDTTVVATQNDLSDYLPLTGGTLNNTGQINTNLSVQSPNSDYHVNTYVPNSGSVEIEIGMSSGHAVQNPSDGDVKNLRVYKDKVDLYTYDSGTSNWRADSLYFPKKKTGTIALDSDLADKQDTLVSGTNIKTINGNSLLGSGDITISGGQSYTAGNGIDITSGTISVDASDLAGSGLTTNLNGELEVDTSNLPFLPLDGGVLSDTTGSTQTVLQIDSPLSGGTVVLITDSPDPGTLQGAQAGVGIYGDVNGTPKSVDFYHDRMVVDGGSYDISYPSVSANDTLAVLSDIPSASDLDGWGLTATGGGELEVDGSVLAGTGITWDPLNKVFNATGGGGTTYTAGTGISIDANNQISAKIANGYGLGTNLNGELLVDAGALAGNGLQVDQNGQLEVVGGGGGSGLWTSGSGVDSLLSIPASTSNGTASGARALSAGWYTTASGDYSVALGNQTSATRTNAFAVGKQSDATGISSVALGDIAAASGDYSVALGSNPVASGTRSFATSNASASGTDAIAIGNGANASANLSVALGTSAKATNSYEIGLGKWNKSTSSGTDAEKTQFTVGNGTALGSELNIIEAKQNNDVYLYGVGNYDGTNAGASGVQTLQDVINNGGGGGSYLPLTGGTLKDTAVGATETLLDVQAPDSTSALSFSADTLAAMIQMSADRDDANVADGTTYGINFDNSGDVDILVKTVNPLDPTDISTTTYTQTFQQKSGTIALLSDISGGGTTYTAGTGISISAQNVISNSAPDPGLWVAGSGTNSIMTSNATSSAGMNSLAIGQLSSALGNNTVAIGMSATAGVSGGSGTYGMALGRRATVKSQDSIAIGYASGNVSSTTCNNAIAIGNGAKFTNANEFSIGNYNITTSTGTTAEKTQFTIGNGTADNARSNLIEAKQNNDIYVVGVGGFDGTNAGSTGVHTLQYAIANAGGGGGLWTSGTGTDSLVAPATITAGLSVDPAQGTGAISCGYDTNADGDYAFASGAQALASGDYSFAANNGTSSGDYSAAFNTSGAYGDESFAAGTGSTANATSSIALAGGTTLYDDQDPNNIIDAAGSVAIGDGAAANAYRAIAIGSSASTSDIAIDGIAIGVGAYANAQEATAIGSSSTAEGLGTVALSSGTASGERSTAMSSGDAIGSYSVAGGLDAIAGAYSSVALGFNTMTYDQGDPTDPSEANAGEAAFGRYNYTEQDFIFTVGCGQEIYHDPDDPDFEPNPEDPDNPDGWYEIVRKNAITITSDGSIYIKGAGGYLGQGITGADSLQTLLYNLNPQ